MVTDRIYWTDSEKEQLARWIFEERKLDPVTDLCTLAKSCILRFPEGRRRNITGLHQISTIIERFKQLWEEFIFEEKKLIEQTEQLQNLEEESTPELVGRAVTRLLEELFHKEYEVVNSKPNPIKIEMNQRTKLPKVVIAGMLPAQTSLIQKHLDKLCELNFLDKNLHAGAVPQGADLYVIWTDFCSHAINNQCKKLSRGNYILHKGGANKMVEVIKKNIVKRFYKEA